MFVLNPFNSFFHSSSNQYIFYHYVKKTSCNKCWSWNWVLNWINWLFLRYYLPCFIFFLLLLLFFLFFYFFYFFNQLINVRCTWKWNFRTNFTQSLCHSVAFHIHMCVSNYYIDCDCKELDYFPSLINRVNAVGCGSASLPTWITRSLGKGICYNFIDNVLCRFTVPPASQVNGRC